MKYLMKEYLFNPINFIEMKNHDFDSINFIETINGRFLQWRYDDLFDFVNIICNFIEFNCKFEDDCHFEQTKHQVYQILQYTD